MAHSTLKKRRSTRRPVEMTLQPGPRPSTIHAILSYSKALKVVDVPPVGKIDVVLN